jgi:DNA-binding NtrC family response regulator
VAQGTFREDLMYRLRVVELEVPPLRRRADDIPMLVEHFLAENRKAGVGRVERVAPAALARLREAPWPGNVRQLETVLKSACLFAVGDVLQAADVEPLLQREKAVDPRGEGGDAPDWLANAPLEEVITRVIEARVVTCGGNKRKAAETLGIDRGTLYNRLKTL